MSVIENTYTTSQIAKIVGIHPNTVRLYEELGFVSKVPRKENGYRIFTEIHLEQFKIVRLAFQIVILQNGLRKKIVHIVKLSGLEQYNEAITCTEEYIQAVEMEIKNAEEAIKFTNMTFCDITQEKKVFLKRKDVSKLLSIPMDTLRNWEMNGLIKIKRKDNGYRVYSNEDIRILTIIKSLRCANYSLAAILRMVNKLHKRKTIDVYSTLNSPDETEDIISACDKLIPSLNAANYNANKIKDMLISLQNKKSNPPF